MQLEAFRRQKAETKAQKAVPAPQLPGRDDAGVAATPSGEPPSHQAPALPTIRYAGSANGATQETSPYGSAAPATSAQSPGQDPGRGPMGLGPAGVDAHTVPPQPGEGAPPSSAQSGPGADVGSLSELQPAPELPVSRPVLMTFSPPDSMSKVVDPGNPLLTYINLILFHYYCYFNYYSSSAGLTGLLVWPGVWWRRL